MVALVQLLVVPIAHILFTSNCAKHQPKDSLPQTSAQQRLGQKQITQGAVLVITGQDLGVEKEGDHKSTVLLPT